MKKWYRSNTIRVALLQAAAGIFLAFGTEYPDVGYVITAKSVIDFVLRYLTSKPIG